MSERKRPQTANDLWNDYADTTLPKGTPINSIQYNETHRAFMAGMFTCLNVLLKISELPEDLAVEKSGQFEFQIKNEIQMIIAADQLRQSHKLNNN